MARIPVPVRFDSQELERLRRAAEAAGLRRTTFIRQAALAVAERTLVDDADRRAHSAVEGKDEIEPFRG